MRMQQSAGLITAPPTLDPDKWHLRQRANMLIDIEHGGKYQLAVLDGWSVKLSLQINLFKKEPPYPCAHKRSGWAQQQYMKRSFLVHFRVT